MSYCWGYHENADLQGEIDETYVFFGITDHTLIINGTHAATVTFPFHCLCCEAKRKSEL